MRIRLFNKLLENEAKEHLLKNCDVVIDGQNFFYHLYKASGLPFAFGCESDKYANFLRNHLNKFRTAGVKCHFIFKGGSEDMKKKVNTITDRPSAKDYVPGADLYYKPILAKCVYLQVLDEMGFNYAVTKCEAKRECIALAQQLDCPIISYDVEFSFSGVQYIMSDVLLLDETKKGIACRIINLQHILQKFRITKEKLAVFIVLTDECSDFPQDYFVDFIKSLRANIKLPHYQRNMGLLQWLSRTPLSTAVDKILKFLKPEDRKKFQDKLKKINDMIGRNETLNISAMSLLDNKSVQITEKDPLWFEKGVASKVIAVPYIDFYNTNILMGSSAIEDKNANDGLLLSLDIIKYAYNLLTNYKHKNIKLYRDEIGITNINIKDEDVKKPKYQAKISVFENGWNGIRDLGLFEHFLGEILKFNYRCLEKLPEDARMLVLALAYFSYKKSAIICDEVYSVLLSYIMLGVVNEKDQHFIPDYDCTSASLILIKYFELDDAELRDIFDVRLVHTSTEFQHCLLELNYLNLLCGSPYKPTVYHKTYNATFVYKILYAMKVHGDGMEFLRATLQPARTVLEHLMNLVDGYRQLMPQI